MVQPSLLQDRQIRVFVSSTFRDMQVERDHLVKKIFPQLRKLCEERAVTWTEVDLRWGITTEEASEGMVLPLCLAEIQRCRPYFIGLVGERYGWMPKKNEIRAAVRNEDATLYLGQLKTLFDQGIQPMPSRNTSVLEHLQQSLSADQSALFSSIYDAINTPDGLTKLSALPSWKTIPLRPLDDR